MMVLILNLDTMMKMVKQKQWSFAPGKNQMAAKEVNKLLHAVFIRKVQYLDNWLANIIVVKKVKK